MRFIDLSSWHGVLMTLLGLALFALMGVGTRVLIMQTVQQRRERMNRQINERLRTLIAAYRTLGGSFTGRLTVDPRHLRDVRVEPPDVHVSLPDVRVDRPDMRVGEGGPPEGEPGTAAASSTERSRRIRDAVGAALSGSILR